MIHYLKTKETSERSFLEQEKPLITKEIPISDSSYFLSRFPLEKTKIAYETTIHTKTTMDTTEYDIGFATPFGKRAYLWHTYSPNNTSIAMIIELNRENQLGDIFFLKEVELPIIQPNHFQLGMIVSGILYEEGGQETDLLSNIEKVFIVDDIHMYKGEMISRKTFYEKTGYLLDFFRTQHYQFPIRFPVFWPSSMSLSEIPSIPYHYRHIQYRATRKILPHLNFIATKTPPAPRNTNINPNQEIKPVNYKWNWKFDYSKPIYRKTACFYVRADTMFDVYFLGARMDTSDKTNIVYCQHALILNYKTSIFMNGIFRNIRENANIDAIEDSDDESDFENIEENKYVDLEKEVLMECAFHYKFKKWMPFRIVTTNTISSTCSVEKDDKKVVSIFNL